MKVKTASAICQTLNRYVAFDFEYDVKTHVLLAASFVDNFKNKKTYLNNNSHSEISLIENINAELLEYDYSMGWNTSTSIDSNNGNTNGEDDFLDNNSGNGNGNNTEAQCDLGILYERCEANGIENIVSKSRKGSQTYYSIPVLKHIDLYQVYKKQITRPIS